MFKKNTRISEKKWGHHIQRWLRLNNSKAHYLNPNCFDCTGHVRCAPMAPFTLVKKYTSVWYMWELLTWRNHSTCGAWLAQRNWLCFLNHSVRWWAFEDVASRSSFITKLLSILYQWYFVWLVAYVKKRILDRHAYLRQACLGNLCLEPNKKNNPQMMMCRGPLCNQKLTQLINSWC